MNVLPQNVARCMVDADADVGHNLPHHGGQMVVQFLLVEVVLVHAHPHRARWNLDELRQRILEAAGDGHGSDEQRVGVSAFRQTDRQTDRQYIHIDIYIYIICPSQSSPLGYLRLPNVSFTDKLITCIHAYMHTYT